MTALEAIPASLTRTPELRRWISRAFIVSILVYLVVLGYLLFEAVTGASRWAPFGVNIPTFIALVIGSEIVIILTAVWIFRDDSGIWPSAVSDGWTKLRSGSVVAGLKTMLAGAWDISIVDLRLRTTTAIYLGRINRIAALAPLVYALGASAGGAPWGLRASAFVDIAITLVAWAFMELVMVRRDEATLPHAPATQVVAEAPTIPDRETSRAIAARSLSTYEVRRVELSDVDRIEEIERIKWEDRAATREMVLSRLKTFPEGQLAAIHVTEIGGVPVRRTLVAWCTAMPASESQVRAFRSWDHVTSSGTIRNGTRDGSVLVGVNLTSVTEGATYLLSGEILAFVVEWGKSKLLCGSRLTGFSAFNDHRRSEGKPPASADRYARLREIRGYRLNEGRIDAGQNPLPDGEYVRLVNSLRAERGEAPLLGEEVPDYVCSNVRGYMSIPGARMVEVVPDYFDDAASDGYGVLLEWRNPLPAPLRHIPQLKSWTAKRIRKEVREEWERRKQRVQDRAKRRVESRVPAFLRRGAEASSPAEQLDGASTEQDRDPAVPRERDQPR